MTNLHNIHQPIDNATYITFYDAITGEFLYHDAANNQLEVLQIIQSVLKNSNYTLSEIDYNIEDTTVKVYTQ